jgi:hypothetical protein
VAVVIKVQALSLPQTLHLHSVAMLQAEGRGLELDCSVFTHNKPNPPLTTIPEVDDDTGARMRASIPHTHHTPS